MMRATEGILVKIWADTCYFVSEIQSSNSLNYVRRILAFSSGLIFTFDYLQKGITSSRENFIRALKKLKKLPTFLRNSLG